MIKLLSEFATEDYYKIVVKSNLHKEGGHIYMQR